MKANMLAAALKKDHLHFGDHFPVTLANYDSPQNNNVIIPFASGCQSMWTLPFKEKGAAYFKAMVGALDPAMRRHIAADTLLFSVPADRFHAMADLIEKSFAREARWLDLIAETRPR